MEVRSDHHTLQTRRYACSSIAPVRGARAVRARCERGASAVRARCVHTCASMAFSRSSMRSSLSRSRAARSSILASRGVGWSGGGRGVKLGGAPGGAEEVDLLPPSSLETMWKPLLSQRRTHSASSSRPCRSTARC